MRIVSCDSWTVGGLACSTLPGSSCPSRVGSPAATMRCTTASACPFCRPWKEVAEPLEATLVRRARATGTAAAPTSGHKRV